MDWIKIMDNKAEADQIKYFNYLRQIRGCIIQVILRNREKNASGPGDTKTLVKRCKEFISKNLGVPVDQLKTEKERCAEKREQVKEKKQDTAKGQLEENLQRLAGCTD